MTRVPETLAGKSIEWTGAHHSKQGDFGDLSSHVVTYETESKFHVTASGKRVGERQYTYSKMDEQTAIVIYHPDKYQGRRDVVLYAMLDFAQHKDRAVILAGGQPFAIADGSMREVDKP